MTTATRQQQRQPGRVYDLAMPSAAQGPFMGVPTENLLDDPCNAMYHRLQLNPAGVRELALRQRGGGSFDGANQMPVATSSTMAISTAELSQLIGLTNSVLPGKVKLEIKRINTFQQLLEELGRTVDILRAMGVVTPSGPLKGDGESPDPKAVAKMEQKKPSNGDRPTGSEVEMSLDLQQRVVRDLQNAGHNPVYSGPKITNRRHANADDAEINRHLQEQGLKPAEFHDF